MSSMTSTRKERARLIAEGLNSAAVHLLRRLRRVDLALGVGPARLSALSVLVFGGPRSLGELSGEEQVTPATMSRVVSGLEADGLAVRNAHPKDLRALRITATAKGRRLMYRGRGQRVAQLAAQLEKLSRVELGHLESAVRILRRLEEQPRVQAQR